MIGSFKPNLYEDKMYYNKDSKFWCLDMKNDEITQMSEHKCENPLIKNNKIYYLYYNTFCLHIN